MSKIREGAELVAHMLAAGVSGYAGEDYVGKLLAQIEAEKERQERDKDRKAMADERAADRAIRQGEIDYNRERDARADLDALIGDLAPIVQRAGRPKPQSPLEVAPGAGPMGIPSVGVRPDASTGQVLGLPPEIEAMLSSRDVPEDQWGAIMGEAGIKADTLDAEDKAEFNSFLERTEAGAVVSEGYEYTPEGREAWRNYMAETKNMDREAAEREAEFQDLRMRQLEQDMREFDDPEVVRQMKTIVHRDLITQFNMLAEYDEDGKFTPEEHVSNIFKAMEQAILADGGASGTSYQTLMMMEAMELAGRIRANHITDPEQVSVSRRVTEEARGAGPTSGEPPEWAVFGRPKGKGASGNEPRSEASVVPEGSNTYPLTEAINPRDLLRTDKFRITSMPGERRSTGVHRGTDVAAEQGTEITMPVSGEVIEAGFQKGLAGYFAKVRDAMGRVHFFAHMDGPADVEVGDYIDRGGVVGKVGKTGRATGFHLHYELRDDDGG